MLVSGFFKGSADKADIVGGTAAAAGLTDNYGNLVCVVPAGEDGVHNLSHHHQGGIASIVIDILKPHVHRLLIIIGQDFNVVARGCKSRL